MSPYIQSLVTGTTSQACTITGKREFLNRLVRVHDKSILVYDVLRMFRESSNLKKFDGSLGELIDDPDRDKKVEKLYYELRKNYQHHVNCLYHIRILVIVEKMH